MKVTLQTRNKAYGKIELNTYDFTKKIYRVLRDRPGMVRFRKMKNRAGLIHEGFENNRRPAKQDFARIWLDPRQSVLATTIHEFIHWTYPTLPESYVRKLESKVINALTERQAVNLLTRLAEVVIHA
jgi:hypothetical protein